MPEDTMPASKHWTLDKRIPLALVITIGIQTALFGFWIGTLSQRVTQIETAQSLATSQPERIVRLETQMHGVQTTVDRIDRKLDVLIRGERP